MKSLFIFPLFFLSFFTLWSSPPVPYTGKLAINTVNYHGNANFTFSLHDGNGTTHWRNGADANASIQVFVRNGRYSILLGGQGMNVLPSSLFLTEDELYLKVHFDNHDGSGLRPLSPDQRITATPYALAAEWAKMATLSQGVSPGAITRTMLSAEVLADLNNSASGSESNATFSPTPGSIVRSMLASDVQSDLNRTVTKSMLGSDVLADLNKTITRAMLPASVLTDLNRTISKSMLGNDVLSDLNSTLSPGSVTRDKLSADILADLNKTITKSMLGSDVLADLNQSIKTITRDMLPASVLTDLNRTVTKSMLGSDVLADLNRTVTPQMIQSSSITTAQLNEQILKYLKPEITVSPQAPGLIFGGQSMNLTSQAQGKYLTYQWQRNGQPIAGATQASFSIADVNGSLHDGNYSVVVSNDFGSVTSALTPLQVDGTPSAHTVASISMEMIFCPPGTFTMGSPTSESGRGTDETQHQVTLTNGFYLGKYEVTQAQYQTVMNGNSEGLNADPSQFKGSNRPVEKASWEDAQIFLTRLNSIEQSAGRLPNGWKYVLPTEAEWEYACRAGTTTGYSWGNDINSSRANYNWDGGGNDGNDSKQTVEIGQFSANPWGFFDMHGNVWEWVHDWKANYLTGAQTDPEGPASGSDRVFRGGSWNGGGAYLRSAKRNGTTPGGRFSNIGFRVGFQAVKPDGANPELELFGGAGITREAGQAWAEPGAAGHDARDGNLTDSITISGTVDMNTTGTYILTYSVADAAGNEANASRTVTVVDTTHPVLTLLGDANMSQAKDSAWVDPGATASDSLDGNLTSSITITGTVDVNTTGVYTLTYSVSDGASNEVNASRVVNVAADILYVHGTATGAGDGTSWANAYTDLGDALRATTLFTEVWVATGTYKAGMVRSSTFLIPPNIAVYGGFSGNEVSRNSRDVEANQVILSGDLGLLNNNTDNAFHVVVPSQGSVLDGFTITGGNASENFTNDDRGKGAGLWADSASITVSNCKFISNNAYQGGAAIYLKDVNGTFSNCEIISNTTNSTGSGAGLYLEDSNVSFTSSIFSDNQAHFHAGAIRSENSEINLLNCSLSSNRSLTSNGGGAMYLNGGIFSIKSTSFTNNQATFQGGAILISGASGSMEDSNFTGNQNTNSNGGGALLIENSSPSILRCRFIENSTSANNHGGAIKLDTSSASITDSIFIGNRSLTNSAGAIYFDSSSSPSFSNNEFRLNSAAQFGGAFFVNGSNLNLTGDLFLGNYANNGGGIATQGTMSVSLSNVRALGNEANSTSSSSAGLIYLNSGVTSSTFMNSVFSGNKSLGRYGVYRSNGPSRFVNCSIVGNEAGTEGGVTLMFAGDSIELDNCIVWGNTAGTGNDIYVNAGTASANYSLFNPSESIGTISGSSNLNSDPLFVDSDGADNISGTLDDDVSLQSGSPAIDQGSSSLANFSTSDVLSRNRVGSPDLGAYEFASNSVPAFTSGNIFSLSENLTLVTNLNASDLDGDAIVFSISGGVDQNQFSVEASTGLLSFVSAPDFETPTDSGGDNSYTVEVSVSDGNSTSTLLLTISVVDVSEQGSGQASTHNADLNASVQLQMLWVEPGTFTMGSPTTEAGRQSDREDEHNVTLTKGFYLGKYEVTQAQYQAVMTGNTDSLSATPSQWPNNPNRPVEKVSWADAQIFLTRLNAQQSANIPAGWAYVLPTESQWEYACRAGTTTMYSWGNDINATRANYSVSGLSQTRDVGYYAANPLGFFDMHGNVWEWTADWYQAAYPTGNPVVDPTGPASGSNRVRRGGSWNYAGTNLRSAKRNISTPSYRNYNIGFRVGFQKQ